MNDTTGGWSASRALEVRAAYQPMPYLPAAAPLVPAAPAAPAARASAFSKLDRFAPLGLSTPLLVFGRIWHAHGAAHSVGDAMLLGTLSAGALVGAAVTGKSPVIAGTALGVSGGLAAAGIAGYATGLSLPLITWAIATISAYAVAWRGWRADARRAAEAVLEREAKALECSTVLQTEVIRAQRDISVAQINANAAVRVAELTGGRDRAFEARYGMAASPSIPDVDPRLFELSQTAREAIAPSRRAAAHARPARAEQFFDQEKEAA